MRADNHLFYGDNLDVLREHFEAESVDLVYLDPPFNSNANYNILFKSPAGDGANAQVEAFEDTWHWNDRAEAAFDAVRESGHGKTFDLLIAMRQFLGDNDMMAYLAMMAARLVELHRVLKATGSLYLHCDPTASHYLKLLLDAAFGPENFRSEVIWRRSSAHNKMSRQFGPIHDTILFYAKSEHATFHPPTMPYLRQYVEKAFRHRDARGDYRLNELTGAGTRSGDSGQPWRGYDPTTKGRHWAIPASLRQHLPDGGVGLSCQDALDALLAADEIVISPEGRPTYKQRLGEGVPLQDIWAYQPGTEGALTGVGGGIDADVKWLDSEEERLGYPTQKPVGLLERIIATSSNPGDVVLDPFCGCGTAIHAAQKLERRWVGIDVTHLAISLIERRMQSAFPGITFSVEGAPKDLASAEDLARRSKYQFQWWAVSMVDAMPYGGRKKGADGGIDGLIYFKPDGRRTEKAIVSVKGGENVGVSMIRDLHSTMEREKAPIGVFITRAPPSGPMAREAAAVGRFHASATGRSYSRLQILTLADLFQDKRPDIPFVDAAAAFRRPARESAVGQGVLL